MAPVPPFRLRLALQKSLAITVEEVRALAAGMSTRGGNRHVQLAEFPLSAERWGRRCRLRSESSPVQAAAHRHTPEPHTCFLVPPIPRVHLEFSKQQEARTPLCFPFQAGCPHLQAL